MHAFDWLWNGNYSTVIDLEIVPLSAERRYEPIKIVFLCSLSVLIGALSEISGEKQHFISFPNFEQVFEM